MFLCSACTVVFTHVFICTPFGVSIVTAVIASAYLGDGGGISRREARTCSPKSCTAMKARKLLIPTYTFSWNCWTSTCLADSKAFNYFPSSISSYLFHSTYFFYSLACDLLKHLSISSGDDPFRCWVDFYFYSQAWVNIVDQKSPATFLLWPSCHISDIMVHDELCRISSDIIVTSKKWATVAFQREMDLIHYEISAHKYLRVNRLLAGVKSKATNTGWPCYVSWEAGRGKTDT